MSVQFEDVAKSALARAPELLQRWIGGKKRGSEWVGERRANGGPGDSWSVNLANGCWLHGAGDERGGDLVSLYAALNHLDQVAALHEVAKILGEVPVQAKAPEPVAKQPLMPAVPIPEDAGPIPPHKDYGQPSASYWYGQSFVVLRYDLPDGKKQFSQFTWRGGKWTGKSWPDPKPIYHLKQLEERPDYPVLVVEGEKAAEAAAAVLTGYIVVTWAGGSSALAKSDWTPLKGRDVVIWPDADEPGWKAGAALAEIATKVGATSIKVIDTHGQPEGWDLADAIAEGWDAKQIIVWARDHMVKTISEPEDRMVTTIQDEEPPPEYAPPVSERDTPAVVSYQQLGLDCNEGGMPHATLANASLILQAHPKFTGKLWLDSFNNKIYYEEKEWDDSDDLSVTVWMQQTLRMPKLSLTTVQQAVEHAAYVNQRNSLHEYLDALVWDGVPRLEDWLSDCLGIEKTEYTIAVARNWPISMIARAYVPGCQVDTMPVLEGKMGKGKSTFLKVLGGKWFSSIPAAFGDKDFLQGIQGQWLVEIPDMTGFSRREHTQILATITNRVDRYRASYGRRVKDHPRVAVFAATSETSTYLKDSLGRRRYWPLKCNGLNIDALKSQRDQIFAEAVHHYKKGATWHEVPEKETDEEQMSRMQDDPWTSQISRYISSLEEVRMETLLGSSSCLNLPLEKQGHREYLRVSSIMRRLGWDQTVTKDKDRRSYRIWRKK